MCLLFSGHNQRLEFLGDSILQLVTSVFLFKHFPSHHEGHLSVSVTCLVVTPVFLYNVLLKCMSSSMCAFQPVCLPLYVFPSACLPLSVFPCLYRPCTYLPFYMSSHIPVFLSTCLPKLHSYLIYIHFIILTSFMYLLTCGYLWMASGINPTVAMGGRL